MEWFIGLCTDWVLALFIIMSIQLEKLCVAWASNSYVWYIYLLATAIFGSTVNSFGESNLTHLNRVDRGCMVAQPHCYYTVTLYISSS